MRDRARIWARVGAREHGQKLGRVQKEVVIEHKEAWHLVTPRGGQEPPLVHLTNPLFLTPKLGMPLHLFT